VDSRVAIIDMGTNTFHLLVAEKVLPQKIIFRFRVPVKVGQGGINDGMITPEAISRATKTLKDFRSTADNLMAGTILSYATSAIRSASNGNDLLEKIKTETGIETKVINGDEEASLIYTGVRAALDLGSGKSLIVDVGGGSVEFIIADKNDMVWKQSFEIGGQRLLELFHKHDPMLPGEIDALNSYLVEKLSPLFEQLELHKPTVLVGVSGTFDTLSEIYCYANRVPYFADEPETPLTIDSFHQSFNELIKKNRADRLSIPGMMEMRVDMIVVACCLVKLLVDRHKFEAVRVSTWSLKEGALVKYLSDVKSL
jgi:exopolyphosphatase/guanosine-5'-triphosphate,3'-diphosphate pyrophosphatase